MYKNSYLFTLLLIALSFGPKINAATVENGLLTLEATSLYGDSISGGTLLMQTESVTMRVAFDGIFKSSGPTVSPYKDAVINGECYTAKYGLVGDSNPNDLSLDTPPTTGSAFEFETNTDGYIAVFSKLSTTKSYYVSNGNSQIAYSLGFIDSDGNSLYYSLPSDIYGNLDFSSPSCSEYINNNKYKSLAEISPSLTGNGSGIIVFPVSKGNTYIVSAANSKITCGGYIFLKRKPTNIGFRSDAGEYVDFIGDHYNVPDILPGGKNCIIFTGKDESNAYHLLTDSTSLSFSEGNVNIVSNEEVSAVYPLSAIKFIAYTLSTDKNASTLKANISDNTQTPIYIYRNDGVINPFFPDEVKNITYSNYDVDSTCYENPIIQYVNTSDTTYVVHLETVDSISFTNPQNSVNKDVVFLDGEIRNYIISSSENSILFAANTPTSILPKTGAKIATLNVDEKITEPFFGRIYSIEKQSSGINMLCEGIGITDIYDSYFCSFISQDSIPRSRSSQSDNSEYKTVSGINSINIDTTQWPEFSYNGDILELATSGNRFSATLSHSTRYKGFLFINAKDGINLRLSLDGDYDFNSAIELNGEIKKPLKKIFRLRGLAIPISATMMTINVEVGAFLDIMASFSYAYSTSEKYKLKFNWEWSSKQNQSKNNSVSFKQVSKQDNTAGSLNGEIFGGFYGTIGINLLKGLTNDRNNSLAGANIEFKGGGKLRGSFVPTKSLMDLPEINQILYEILRSRSIGLYYAQEFSLNFNLCRLGASLPLFPNTPFNKEWLIKELHHVPSFNDMKIEQTDGGINVSTDVYNNTITRNDVGLALVTDDDMDNAEIHYELKNFKDDKSSLEHKFNIQESNATYTIYPVVKWHDFELFAHPSSKYIEICPDEHHPHLIDLGLASGNKWLCMNHGAESPEKPGKYLAWGEKNEKNYYKYKTYSFWVDKNGDGNWDEGEFTDIGSNIQGTQYDPCNVYGYVMPEKKDFEELIQDCEWESHEINGTKGALITGPNGNRIFLPALGMMVDYDLIESGNGRYWTSNVAEDRCDAILLSFSGDDTSFTNGDRHNGRLIRPIISGTPSAINNIVPKQNDISISVTDRTIKITSTAKKDIIVSMIDGKYFTWNLNEGVNEFQVLPGFYIIGGEKIIIK